MVTSTEVGFNATAPYLISQFHAVMQERIAALGRGEPIVVEVRSIFNKLTHLLLIRYTGLCSEDAWSDDVGVDS